MVNSSDPDPHSYNPLKRVENSLPPLLQHIFRNVQALIVVLQVPSLGEPVQEWRVEKCCVWTDVIQGRVQHGRDRYEGLENLHVAAVQQEWSKLGGLLAIDESRWHVDGDLEEAIEGVSPEQRRDLLVPAVCQVKRVRSNRMMAGAAHQYIAQPIRYHQHRRDRGRRVRTLRTSRWISDMVTLDGTFLGFSCDAPHHVLTYEVPYPHVLRKICQSTLPIEALARCLCRRTVPRRSSRGLRTVCRLRHSVQAARRRDGSVGQPSTGPLRVSHT